MNILLYGDSRSAYVRHEVPVALPDPVGYLEAGGDRHVLAGSLDVPRMTELGRREGFSVTSFEELGLLEVMGGGEPLGAAITECLLRACRRFGVTEVGTSDDFPLAVADHLRAGGIGVTAEGPTLAERRRRKHPAEIDGIRRGQAAAEAAMEAVREGLRSGADPTVEELRDVARTTFVQHGAIPHDLVVIAPGPQGADPHDEGSGPIPAGVPIVVDVFPRDIASGCWGDLTRTLCIGEPPEELVRWHRDVREAQRLATEAVRPGATGEELNGIAMDHLAQQGYKTRHGGAEVEEGFIHYLGHGVGLELHEAPTLDEGGETLVPGDVITIEPGLYRADFGGCRIEDLVLVTETGHEIITRSPYDLTI